MKYTGRQIHVGVGVESSRGEKAQNVTWFPKTSFNFGDKIETIEDESALGLKIDASDIDVIKHYGEGSIEGRVQANNIGNLLLAILGNKETTEVVTSKVFEHLFTIKNNGDNPTLTIFTKEGNGDYYFPLALVNSLTISASVGDYITVSADFKSKKGISDSLTTNYETDYKFKANHSLFKIADSESELESAEKACIESFELTITKESIEDYCLNNGVDPVDISDGKISITGSITAVFRDESYKNMALNGLQKAFEFGLKDTSTNIEGEEGENPTLNFIFPKVKFTDYGKSNENDSLVKQNLSFKAFQDNPTIEAIKVKLKNGKSDY